MDDKMKNVIFLCIHFIDLKLPGKFRVRHLGFLKYKLQFTCNKIEISEHIIYNNKQINLRDFLRPLRQHVVHGPPSGPVKIDTVHSPGHPKSTTYRK